MRLKLLGIFLPLLVACSMAAAAVSQLTNIGVASAGNTTTITLQANGNFTHNEYRPADNLLLVDLTGVTAGKFMDEQKALSLPGVKSYSVLGYKGAAGAEVTRLEVTLEAGTVLHVSGAKDSLKIELNSASAPKAVAEKLAPPKPAPVEVAKATPAPAKPQVAKPAAAAPVKPAADLDSAIRVSNVALVAGKNGPEVEITGPSDATAEAITGPDRIVVDVANSIPTVRSRNIAVNGADVKGVRVSQFQNNPPVTRVVIDLPSAHEFDLAKANGKVTVRLKSNAAKAPEMKAAAPAATKPVAEKPAVVASAAPAKTPVVEPKAPVIVEKKVAAPQKSTPPVAVAKPVAAKPAPVVEKKAVESKPVMVASAAPAKALVPAEAKPKTSEAVFVEPTYKEKPANEEAKPAVDPLVRAAEAAGTIAASKPAPVAPPPPVAMLHAPAVNMAAEQQQAAQMASTAPQSSARRYTGEPISVNLKDVDLKDFFRLIHEISGLNIVLDPNVKGSLTLVLDDVPWDQALEIVLSNNGLERQLEGNVLRIATVQTLRAEAEAKRAQSEAQALAVEKMTITRFLSYAHARDVMPTVKRFLSARGDVIADDRTNALIIQDIPSVLPQVDRLLGQLDRKTQEVEIEARVVAATRNFARDIGTQLGFGWGNRTTAVGGAGGVGSSPLTQGYTNPPPYFTNSVVGNSKDSATPTVTSAGIPLFSNLGVPAPTSGLSFSTLAGAYRLDAILTLAESRGMLKVLSRPRVVTQNNVAANVRQGVRIPVVTQAQLGGPPTVTYVDAFLRLSVTPQITAEGTIFLAVDVENTNADFSRTVQGNPTLVTQQATTQVLVTDGGTVIIGGVIQTQNSVNTQQVPLLGDLPILGNLFKRNTVSTETRELIFFLSPKIIQT